MQSAEGLRKAEIQDLERHGFGLARVAADGSVIDRIGSASFVMSYTHSNFSMSQIISSRLRPVRSRKLISSMASIGHASSHIPQ